MDNFLSLIFKQIDHLLSKLSISTFFLLAVFALNSFGQQLFFCEKVLADGSPSGVAEKWIIDDNGGAVYLLYEHYAALDVKKLTYTVTGKSVAASKEVYVNGEKDHAVLDYFFTEPGKYKVTVGIGDIVYTSSIIEIDRAGTSGVNTYYYKNSQIIACESVDGGEAVRPGKEFVISSRGGYVSFQVINDGKPVEAEKLVVDIYRKGPDSDTYDYLVATMNYDVEKSWKKPYFRYTFNMSGDYRLNVFNENDVWINSSFVIIKRQ